MKRDRFNIIVQDNADDPTYEDGGDSAFSTGLMSFGGSDLDYQLMFLFIKNFQLVRHPFQHVSTGDAPHSDPDATSRDAVLAFFGGLLDRKLEDMPAEGDIQKFQRLKYIILRETCLKYAQSWGVNRDKFSPADKLYLYKCARTKPPLWLALLGRIWQAGELINNCFFNSKHEMNQTVEKNVAFGKIWIWFLYTFHPDLFGNLDEYFGGWRRRQEISDAMKALVKKELGIK